jgi:hypothetical protein
VTGAIRQIPGGDRGDRRSGDPWRPLEPDVRVVQIDHELQLDEYRRLAHELEGRPDVALRVYRDITDLEFLRHFPSLRRLRVGEVYHDLSLDGLRHLPEDMESLWITPARRPMSLRPLARFEHLRQLLVEGPQRDLDVIGRLVSLEDLTLRSVTMPDLGILLPLDRLRALDIKLGGTRDLRLIPRIGRLEYVELWLIRGLDDVTPLGELPALEHLTLQALAGVAALPSFGGGSALRRVDLETMKGLSDLAPLADAPSLEILNLIDFRQARPDILRPFIGHPTLRAGIWGLGSSRRNFAAQDLLPLPPEPYGYAAARGRPEIVSPLPWDEPDWPYYRRHPAS